MVLKALTEAELAILAAGRPASRPDEFQASEKERSRYDRLIKRQRELAKAADPPRPPRRSSRLEQKKLLVSDEWLAKEHSTIGHVEAGTPIASPTHARRRISSISTTPGGSQHIEAEVVAYTIPPPEESASAQKRRFDRGRR